MSLLIGRMRLGSGFLRARPGPGSVDQRLQSSGGARGLHTPDGEDHLRRRSPARDVTYCQYIMAPFDRDMDVLDVGGYQSGFGHHAVAFSYPDDGSKRSARACRAWAPNSTSTCRTRTRLLAAVPIWAERSWAGSAAKAVKADSCPTASLSA